ncbi:hypothetical protein BGX29_002072 [Mortierella sp. GBA35]|nr:hypothetical protein BGX29_002072 [Mortierella sp. GBA35]
MSFKPAFLAVLALLVLQVFMSTSPQVEAVRFPIWCFCGDSKTKTEIMCRFASANWDGGSCGLDNQRAYTAFVDACKQNGAISATRFSSAPLLIHCKNPKPFPQVATASKQDLRLKMSFKPAFLVVLALALLQVNMTTHPHNLVETVNIPIWCICVDKTQFCCNYAGGNWDGGSCGLSNIDKYQYFSLSCSIRDPYNNRKQCWN